MPLRSAQLTETVRAAFYYLIEMRDIRMAPWCRRNIQRYVDVLRRFEPSEIRGRENGCSHSFNGWVSSSLLNAPARLIRETIVHRPIAAQTVAPTRFFLRRELTQR